MTELPHYLWGNSEVLLHRAFTFPHFRNTPIKAQGGVTEQIPHGHPVVEMSRTGQYETLSGIMWHYVSL